MVLAHLHLNMALMRAVLYRCPNVAWLDLDQNKRCLYQSMCPDKFLKCGSNNPFEDVCKFRFQRQITFFINGGCRSPSTYEGTSSALGCTDHISP
jgi:hypothetical protein